MYMYGGSEVSGVYELTSDSRLYEAIQMAGGFTDEAAGEALNQAEKRLKMVPEYMFRRKKRQKPEQRTTVLSVQNADNEKDRCNKKHRCRKYGRWQGGYYYGREGRIDDTIRNRRGEG